VLNGTKSTRYRAFGDPIANTVMLGENITKVLLRAHFEKRRLATPTTRKFPLDRLRRQLAHSMCLDLLFSRRVEKHKIPDDKIREGRPKYYWDKTPLWKTATEAQYQKANKLSSLLYDIVIFGCNANIVRLLVRLSTYVWRLSMRDFNGMCRLILSKIGKSARQIRSSPDPLEHMGMLSNNPILSDRVHRHPPVKRSYLRKIGKLPKHLAVLVEILEERRRRRRATARDVHASRL